MIRATHTHARPPKRAPQIIERPWQRHRSSRRTHHTLEIGDLRVSVVTDALHIDRLIDDDGPYNVATLTFARCTEDARLLRVERFLQAWGI